MNIQFYKYQGTGNDFVMIDDRSSTFDAGNHELVARLCDRKFGVGGDGLILVREHADYDFEMIYFNADGYEGSMCGNGGRACVRFAHDLGIIGDQTTFIAVDGEHEASVTPEVISLKMIDVERVEQGTDFYYMDTGSPHYVEFLEENLSKTDVVTKGKAVRYNDRFKLEGTNVNFVEKVSDSSLFVRTYERGVEDETLSCGTGVTACVLASSYLGYQSPVDVKVLGGDIQISFDKLSGEKFTNIYLTGPAEKVFEGTIEV
ncbi:diaminopimelate epimerase [Cyclobacteriaceae bacterium]|nr:diaminopimelate epimerase [Cyclobacteriaceae bacterium]